MVKNPRMSDKKWEKESNTVDYMIWYYCHKKHHSKKGDYCPSCKELMDYCHFRLIKCLWGEKKPFCANCKIHCYDAMHREKIREVMRFSGPRMFLHRPIMALSHCIQTIKEKKKLERQEKINEKRRENK